MEFGELLALLLIAGLCGGIAQVIVGYSHGNLFASIALGFIGALLGNWIAREMDLSKMLVLDIGSKEFPVIWSIIGAVVFVAVLGLIRRPAKD